MTDNPSSDIETPLGASTSNTYASAIMTCSVNNETSKNTTSEEQNNTCSINNNNKRNYRDKRYDTQVVPVTKDHEGATPEIGGVCVRQMKI